MSVSIIYFLQPQIAALMLWFSHPLSPTPQIGSQLCLLPPLGYTCRTESFVLVYNIYWLGLPIYTEDGNCPVCLCPSDCMGIIRWALVGPMTGLLITITSAIPSSLWLNQSLWPPEGRCLPWSLVLLINYTIHKNFTNVGKDRKPRENHTCKSSMCRAPSTSKKHVECTCKLWFAMCTWLSTRYRLHVRHQNENLNVPIVELFTGN